MRPYLITPANTATDNYSSGEKPQQPPCQNLCCRQSNIAAPFIQSLASN